MEVFPLNIFSNSRIKKTIIEKETNPKGQITNDHDKVVYLALMSIYYRRYRSLHELFMPLKGASVFIYCTFNWGNGGIGS